MKRGKNELLFELDGENYALARAEIRAVLEGFGLEHEMIYSSPGVLALEIEDISKKELSQLGRRPGLIHRMMELLEIGTQRDILEKDLNIALSPGTAGVRTRRIEGRDARTKELKENIGEHLTSLKGVDIDLDEPHHEILVLISDECLIGRVIHEREKEEYRSREVKNRPFFSPVSLKPKYARALVNLARVERGERMHDPFCGTGGVLIEAGRIGLDVSGGDIDEDMVEGCRENLEAYSISGDLYQGDVSETIPEKIDCVVTDPPYGRASTTDGEELKHIYDRLFQTCESRLKKGGYLSAVFPEKRYVERGTRYLSLVEHHEMRVHGSLTRHFSVFKR